ncbi:hypothetical protein HRbin33_00093 [bacterium HR33]|nr:hypothetical protein HRbin33_00093 [bacterium HR33]
MVDTDFQERRRKRRTTLENAATSIVQLLIQHPGKAGELLEEDLAKGGDPEAVLGLLDAAEAILQIRGVDRSSHLAALRVRIRRTHR